ncbi:hypothetical protein Jiend_47120 [Micromonospora endophytica]|nr:hypothetical protein Jiend_47120 [Micromonospora endophytica]
MQTARCQGSNALNTGRKGATSTKRPPSRRRMPSAATHRASPTQPPKRLCRNRSPHRRPTRKLSDQPARQPATTATKAASPVLGLPTATAASTATSPGTRTPKSGTASKSMTTPSTPISNPMGSSPTWASCSAIPRTLGPATKRPTPGFLRSFPQLSRTPWAAVAKRAVIAEALRPANVLFTGYCREGIWAITCT